MNQATDNGSRRTIGRVLGHAAAALLFTAAIIQPKVANAAHGGRYAYELLAAAGWRYDAWHRVPNAFQSVIAATAA